MIESLYLKFFDQTYGKRDWPFFDPNGLLPTVQLVTELSKRSSPLRILVIGDYSGRDTILLEALGFAPDVLDLSRPAHFTDNNRGSFIEANLDEERDLQKINATYDLIVLCEVIEHVFHDFRLLQFLRSRLAENGRLLFSTPLINPLIVHASDSVDFHVQVYTPRQLLRLFDRAGFHAEEQAVRGVILNYWPTIPFRAMVFLRKKILGDRQAFLSVVRWSQRLYRWGSRSNLARWLSMWSWAYGYLAVLRPCDPSVDFHELNKKEFLTCHQADSPHKDASCVCS